MKQGLPVILSLIVFTSLCDTINQVFLKSAINTLSLSSPVTVKKIIRFIVELIKVPRVWGSFFFSILSLSVWLVVLSKADLNFAFSLDSMVYVFIAYASQHILKEKVCFKRWSGTILVIMGIILVTLS